MRFLFLPDEKKHEYPSSLYIKEQLTVSHLLCEFARSASIEGGTISWLNGADIAPEVLHKKIANNTFIGQTGERNGTN